MNPVIADQKSVRESDSKLVVAWVDILVQVEVYLILLRIELRETKSWTCKEFNLNLVSLVVNGRIQSVYVDMRILFHGPDHVPKLLCWKVWRSVGFDIYLKIVRNLIGLVLQGYQDLVVTNRGNVVSDIKLKVSCVRVPVDEWVNFGVLKSLCCISTVDLNSHLTTFRVYYVWKEILLLS